MKILTNKKVDELLKQITACQIIAFGFIEDFEAYEKITENLIDMAVEIDGIKGLIKYNDTTTEYMDKCIEEINKDVARMIPRSPIRPSKH